MTPLQEAKLTEVESIQVDIEWSKRAVISSLKDFEEDLLKLSQNPNYKHTEKDIEDHKSFIKSARTLLKAIETYLD